MTSRLCIGPDSPAFCTTANQISSRLEQIDKDRKGTEAEYLPVAICPGLSPATLEKVQKALLESFPKTTNGFLQATCYSSSNGSKTFKETSFEYTHTVLKPVDSKISEPLLEATEEIENQFKKIYGKEYIGCFVKARFYDQFSHLESAEVRSWHMDGMYGQDTALMTTCTIAGKGTQFIKSNAKYNNAFSTNKFEERKDPNTISVNYLLISAQFLVHNLETLPFS